MGSRSSSVDISKKIDTSIPFKKLIVIIGGSSGLGVGLSFKLKNNYEVISLSSKDLDITNQEDLRTFFNNKKVDILINLSGYNYDCLIHKYEESNYLEIDKQIDIVCKGGINVLNACLPKMRKAGYGRIIFISSILVSKPVIGTSVYTASKSFIESLMKTCAKENSQKGITSNAIQLGYFNAGLTKKIAPANQITLKENIPSKRWGELDELENVIRCIIQTEYINGSVLRLTGGAEL